jgi:hypothetical protein
MPDAETAPAVPADNIVIDVDIASIELPDVPGDAEASGSSGSATTVGGSDASDGESTTTEAGAGTPTTVAGTTTTAG